MHTASSAVEACFVTLVHQKSMFVLWKNTRNENHLRIFTIFRILTNMNVRILPN